MQPQPTPEPYTLPLTIRIDRSLFIVFSIIFLPVIAGLFNHAAFTDPPDNIAEWMFFILILAFFSLIYLYIIMPEIRLTEDKVSIGRWFYRQEMEYSRITAVRYYSQPSEYQNLPMVELSGDSGNTITIGLGIFDSPKNRFIIYDVLKKKATRAGIKKPRGEFFIDPDETPWIKNLLPELYMLPLTLRMNQDSSTIWYATLPLVIAGLVMVALFANALMNIPGWVMCLVGIAGVLLWYLLYYVPEIRLTEDRISYREKFFWKEMEFSRITAVRYYYRDRSFMDSGPMLELSGDTGDTITMRFGMNPRPANLWITYDVLKKKACRAGLGNSAEEFFSHPCATGEN